MITTLLLDLDGVVRHFDPSHGARVERRHGVPRGSLTAAAFDPLILGPAITGRMSRAEWARRIGDRVGSHRAVEDWLADRGTVDGELLALVDRLRASGVIVAVLTNATTGLEQEVVDLGLADRFDSIFSSALLGYAKPDPRAFEAVCRALGVRPGEVFFTDDSPSKLAGAISLGMDAEPFTSVNGLRDDLRRRRLLGPA